MKKIILPSLIGFVVFYLVSCKKDSGDTPAGANLQGSYKFISLTATTNAIQTVTYGSSVGKTITTTNYTTTYNTGTAVIDATKITSIGLSYSILAIAATSMYQDDLLTYSGENPVPAVAPTSDATSEYKVISSDSIYFPSGSAISGNIIASSTPCGAKYRFEGDKLILTVTGEKTTQQTQLGLSMTLKEHGNVIATYQKQ